MLPILVATWSSGHSNVGIAGSNLTQGMNVFPYFSKLSCDYSALDNREL
jgi:hypothetical protein